MCICLIHTFDTFSCSETKFAYTLSMSKWPSEQYEVSINIFVSERSPLITFRYTFMKFYEHKVILKTANIFTLSLYLMVVFKRLLYTILCLCVFCFMCFGDYLTYALLHTFYYA